MGMEYKSQKFDVVPCPWRSLAQKIASNFQISCIMQAVQALPLSLPKLWMLPRQQSS